MEIREVSGYDALKRWVDVRNAVFPHDRESAQVLALARAREVGHVNLLALVDGEAVATAMLPDDPGTQAATHVYVEVGVLPAFRGRGIGTALFRDVSARVMARGKDGLECEALASDPRSLEWLVRRGFRELSRHAQLVLDADDPLADAPLPDGVALHPVGSRPELVAGMFDVAHVAYGELPGPLSGQAGTVTEWQVYELGQAELDLDLSLVAERAGTVLGYVTVMTPAASDDALLRMTAVLPSAAPELAAALVREQAVRARAAGRRRVVAWSLNRPIDEVFARLGFSARDESVMMRGPLL